MSNISVMFITSSQYLVLYTMYSYFEMPNLSTKSISIILVDFNLDDKHFSGKLDFKTFLKKLGSNSFRKDVIHLNKKSSVILKNRSIVN